MHCDMQLKKKKIVIFPFSVCLGGGLPVRARVCVCVSLWLCNELMEKRPSVCWERDAPLPGTMLILHLCGSIIDLAQLFSWLSNLVISSSTHKISQKVDPASASICDKHYSRPRTLFPVCVVFIVLVVELCVVVH